LNLKEQLLWQAVANHYDGLESNIYLYEKFAENPLQEAKKIMQIVHGDLLYLIKSGVDIWPETIRDASMAARILETVHGEEVPPLYRGHKWRSLCENDE